MSQILERTYKLDKLYYQMLKSLGGDGTETQLYRFANLLVAGDFIKLIAGPKPRYSETPKMQSQFYSKNIKLMAKATITGVPYGNSKTARGDITKHYTDLDAADFGYINVCMELDAGGSIVDIQIIEDALLTRLGSYTKEDLEDEIKLTKLEDDETAQVDAQMDALLDK